MSQRFRTTHWSLVLAGAQKETPEGREALERLCEAYWHPLYAYIRRQGYDIEGARDLTQAYFARLLEKNYLSKVKPEAGRFRSFLLSSLNHFLANERDRSHASKRGGVRAPISLDTGKAEQRYRSEPADDLTPEKLFESPHPGLVPRVDKGHQAPTLGRDVVVGRDIADPVEFEDLGHDNQPTEDFFEHP